MSDDILSQPKFVSFLRVGKRRLEIFHKACTKFNLTIVDYTTKDCLILIDDELDVLSANKIFKNSSSIIKNPIFIRTQWLSDSIKQNKLLSHQSYILHTTIPTQTIVTETSNSIVKNEIITESLPRKRERSISSSASDTDDEPTSKKIDIQPIQPGQLPRTVRRKYYFIIDLNRREAHFFRLGYGYVLKLHHQHLLLEIRMKK